jgi:hypothetical protein
MFEISEVVVVAKDGDCFGFAKVVAVCKTKTELKYYFDDDHPLMTRYSLFLDNHQAIYIVDFLEDAGRGGFTQNELRKTGKP